MPENTTRPWLAALRLRTLPLATAGILLGGLLAAAQHTFSWVLFILTLATALSFQLLSNLANDLGDGLRGTDAQRTGEARMVASGLIQPDAMKRAVWALAVVSALLTLVTSWLGTRGLSPLAFGVFVVLGLAAIWAAIRYTMGSSPYGYKGMGDFFVIVFFGLVSVPGTYFLQVQELPWYMALPALTVGMLSAGVLNLNNMRDAEQDALTGKNTLVVKRGLPWARMYHLILVVGAFDLAWAYQRFFGTQGRFTWLFWLGAPLFIIHLRKVLKAEQPKDFEPLLPQLALFTLLFALLLGLGQML